MKETLSNTPEWLKEAAEEAGKLLANDGHGTDYSIQPFYRTGFLAGAISSEAKKYHSEPPQVGKEGEDEKDAAYKALSDQLEFLAGKIINRDKEIERLKGLIKQMFDGEGYPEDWAKFKTENNL
jgi:hypothetical protein